MKKIFIGVDFSKETFDVGILNINYMEEIKQSKFSNTQEGCHSMVQWVKEQVKSPRRQ